MLSIPKEWKLAADMDTTLSFRKISNLQFKNKRLSTAKYTPDSLFRNMSKGKIVIYRDFPITNAVNSATKVVEGLCKADTSQRVWIGFDHNLFTRSIRRIAKDWDSEKTVLGVTDYHFRDTYLEKKLDIDPISKFNLLLDGKRGCETQEMMTFVLASSGYFTDSHSDDPDGSNHCIMGKKLWLAWDTQEGISNGLEDVERCDTSGNQAKFSLSSFLRLKSSRWFYVRKGETLFLPGNFTHKVYTIEKYAGFGSFYVSLPNYLRTMSRWILHGPMWAKRHQSADKTLVEIANIAVNQLSKLLKRKSNLRNQMGFDFIDESIKAWRREYPSEQMRMLKNDWKIQKFLNSWEN